ncbi:MAG: hypothetical protein ACQESN_09385 [Thermotogota bacterium]
MKSIENTILDINRYGFFGRPILNYEYEKKKDQDLIFYLEVMNLYGQFNHEEVIRMLDRNIEHVSNISIYYLLLTIKMSSYFILNNEKYKSIFNTLYMDLEKIPEPAKKIVTNALISVDSKLLENSNKIPEDYHTNKFLYSNHMMVKARSTENMQLKKELHIKSLLSAKKIPNPSLIIANLLDCYRAFNTPTQRYWILRTAVYYSSYYFSSENRIINIYDEYLKYIKDRDYFRYITELFILTKSFSKLNILQEADDAELFDLDLNKKYYRNTSEVQELFKDYIDIFGINKFLKKSKLGKRSVHNIINGKADRVQAKTLYELFQDDFFKDKFFCEISIEKFKNFLDNKVENSIKEIRKKKSRNFLIDLITIMITVKKINKKVFNNIYNVILHNEEIKLNYNEKMILYIIYKDYSSIFLKAKQTLLKKSFKNFDESKLVIFYDFFLDKIDFKNRTMLSILLENISRLEEIDIEIKSDLRLQDNKFFDKKNVLKALWYFDEKQRKKLIPIYNNMIEALYYKKGRV